MIKTLKKAIAIITTLVFVLSLVPFGVIAETAESPKVEMINEFYGDGGTARPYENFLRAANSNGGYRAFFQFDFSGYEYLLYDADSTLELSLQGGTTSTSVKTSSFRIYTLPDKHDGYAALYQPTGLNFNTLSGYLTTTLDHDNDIPFAERTDSTITTSVLKLVGNKQQVLDSLSASTDDSVVTFQFIGVANSVTTKNAGFTHNSANTYLQINSASENATAKGYADEVAGRLSWSDISNEPQKNVNQTLSLPKKYLGTDITWTSSNTDAVNPSSGEVTINPAAYTHVTLTANLSYRTYEGATATATKDFELRLSKELYDYSTGTGVYYHGDNNFIDHSGSDPTHTPKYTKVGGVCGKTENDLCYMIQDASGNRRYEMTDPKAPGVQRDVFELDICVPSNGYGFHALIETDAGGFDTTFAFKKDGLYNSRYNEGNGEKLISYDGTKWHHVAVEVPGVVSSDASGITYDHVLKIYIDGELKWEKDNKISNPTPKKGIVKISLNGLCPVSDWTEDSAWNTVACYIDNIRWTNDIYVPERDTKPAVVSTLGSIDNIAEIITVITDGSTTVKDVIESFTKDEDASARMYDAQGNILDETEFVADGYTLVVADTHGTTSERSFAYYKVRVPADGETVFDTPYITMVGSDAFGTVKVHNNTSGKKSYVVYIATYETDGTLKEIKTSYLEAQPGKSADITTKSLKGVKKEVIKLFIWEEDEITPAHESLEKEFK